VSRRLTDGLGSPRPGPEAQAPQATPQQVHAPPDQLVDVYLTTAVRTSQGPGPGPKTLPAAEANRLIVRKLAIAGDQPPRGFLGHPEGPDRPFDDNHNPQGSRHDDGLRR